MAHTLLWPTKTPFSPIGTLPAVSLTQDLSPEQPADILLLGCGDPRNILYTLFSDAVTPVGPRKLDITCCDLEPAILARNILLFTLLEDNQPIDQIWDIFYHFKISDQASATLTRQSQRLYDLANDIETWQQSLYGSFIKFVDTRTLAQLRKYWKSYADFPDLPSDRLDKLLQEQLNASESALKKNSPGMKASLSAGMFWAQVAIPVNKLFKRYWQTGTVLAQEGDVQVATALNPTFVYSAAGETFDLNNSTFAHGFHLASAVAPIHSNSSVTVALGVEIAITNTMMQQFKAWADAFRAARAAKVITLRFYSGEALVFCRALDRFASTNNPVTGMFVSQWCASQIHFDVSNIGTSPAPVAFDVIDTSNLTDSLDILNLLIATRPILKDSTSSQSVLYTATDLSEDEQDIIRPVLDRLYTDIPTFSLLLKLAPRDYLSSFTTHSHVHEKLCSDHVKTFYERIAWVNPSGGDVHASQQNISVSFDAKQFAHVMFGIYDGMFAREQTMVRLMGERKISLELPFHYTRETMTLLLQLLKRRVHLKNGDWDVFGDKFIEHVERDRNEIIGPLYYQDICLQLHLCSVHTVGSLESNWRIGFSPPSPSEIFKDWSNVPPVLCVVLTVPRTELRILLENQDKTGIPTLECHLTPRDFHPYAYSSIHAVWGKCSIFEEPNTVTLEEDKDGFTGKSDLVVMFWASSRILEFKGTIVSLALKNSTHSSGMFSIKLGQELALYSTPIEDSEHIQILRYQPAIANGSPATLENSVTHFPIFEPTNGLTSIAANVGSGLDARHVVSFTARIEIDLPAEQKLLLDGAEVKISHISPCTMRLLIGSHDHTVPHPYPVLSNGYKLRVARKSHYAEVGCDRYF
ncbi:hypothetical protein FRC12_020788 [Ceratobasidium sp. 428]|nr:hypothetical protein FRC12_020788 [Ceratobasidium sp. 428]